MSSPSKRPTDGLRERRPKPRKGAAGAAPKRTQRDRLTDAIIQLSAKGGYQSVSIAQISARARVSSATFYELFEGKEDCLLAAYRSVAQRLIVQTREGTRESGDWREILHDALGTLTSALRVDPDSGRLVFVEAAAGGPLIDEERKRVLGQFERLAQVALDAAQSDDERLDLPVTALVGALRSIISRRLRTSTVDELPSMTEDIIGWLASYVIPPSASAWSTSERALLPASLLVKAPTPDVRVGRRLPRGRHGLPAGVVARSQRTRIIYATADVTMEKGFANATVADIVARAGVARDVFYEHFADKQQAFLEAQQHPTQHIVDTCASAYFSAERWPERVWSGISALLTLIASAPALSHLRLVECYAAGPVAIRRAEEITRSFTIFLEEGYSCRAEAQKLPRLSSEAITGAVFEIIQRHAMRHDFAGIPSKLPQITYIAIAPFTGPEEAARLIEKFSAQQSAAGSVGTGGRAAD